MLKSRPDDQMLDGLLCATWGPFPAREPVPCFPPRDPLGFDYPSCFPRLRSTDVVPIVYR